MRALRILPEVAADVAEAARWYDEEGYLGLGDRFVATFYSCVAYLQDHGEMMKKFGSEKIHVVVKNSILLIIRKVKMFLLRQTNVLIKRNLSSVLIISGSQLGRLKLSKVQILQI